MPSVSLPSGKGSENSCTVHTLTAAARRNTSLREGGGLGRSPKTEGASGQETNLTTGGGTSPGLKFSHAPSQESAGFNRHRVSAVMSRCQPISKPSAYSPLAPSVTAKATGGSPAVPAPSRRELWGLYLATLVCCSGGSASCESLSRLRRQLPLAREPRRAALWFYPSINMRSASGSSDRKKAEPATRTSAPLSMQVR